MTEHLDYRYQLYGLSIESDFELPELGEPKPADHDLNLVDRTAQIVRDRVPTHLDGGKRVEDYLEFTGTECIYFVKDVAKYLISGGKKIVIEPASNASPIDVRFYLFGTIFGALLHQRHLLPLHLSAVETPSGVVAFTGPSGAGKSTVANEIHIKTGWRLLSDDVAVIDPAASSTLLHCGMFRQKLWKDTVERAGLVPASLTRDTTRAEKFHVFSPDLFATEPLHLRTLVTLEVADTMKLVPIGPSKAFALVMNTIYRPDLALVFADKAETIQNAAKVANEIRTYKFDRPWSVGNLSASTRCLIEFFS